MPTLEGSIMLYLYVYLLCREKELDTDDHLITWQFEGFPCSSWIIYAQGRFGGRVSTAPIMHYYMYRVQNDEDPFWRSGPR